MSVASTDQSTPLTEESAIVLSVAEFERRTGLSHSTVAEMIATQQIASFKVGRRRLIPMSAVHEWITAGLQEAGCA
jgi:excisionase family DNA binding protein